MSVPPHAFVFNCLLRFVAVGSPVLLSAPLRCCLLRCVVVCSASLLSDLPCCCLLRCVCSLAGSESFVPGLPDPLRCYALVFISCPGSYIMPRCLYHAPVVMLCPGVYIMLYHSRYAGSVALFLGVLICWRCSWAL